MPQNTKLIKRNPYHQAAYWSFICLFAYELVYWLQPGQISADIFFLLLYVSIGSLVFLYRRTYWRKDLDKYAIASFYLLLICNSISILRGMFNASSYFDWKFIFVGIYGGLSLVVPITMIVGLNPIFSRTVFKLFFKLIKWGFLLVPIALIWDPAMYQRLMTPLVIFLILIPYYSRNDRIFIFLAAFISMFIALGWRANALRLLLSCAILLVYYFRTTIKGYWFVLINILLFTLPLYYLFQGLQGKNVFELNTDEEYLVSSGKGEEDLTADTRTALYAEVLTDLKSSNQLVFGKGASGKYKTESFSGRAEEEGRDNVEVGFLKIMIYTGIVGVILNGLVIGLAIYYGCCRSKNNLTKMLSLFLACHWLILFMENIIAYNLYFYFCWVAIGLCFSKQFRNLTDSQIKSWLRYG